MNTRQRRTHIDTHQYTTRRDVEEHVVDSMFVFLYSETRCDATGRIMEARNDRWEFFSRPLERRQHFGVHLHRTLPIFPNVAKLEKVLDDDSKKNNDESLLDIILHAWTRLESSFASPSIAPSHSRCLFLFLFYYYQSSSNSDIIPPNQSSWMWFRCFIGIVDDESCNTPNIFRHRFCGVAECGAAAQKLA